MKTDTDMPTLKSVLSLDKPIAQKDYPCAWGNSNPHVIAKGRKHVRVVWENEHGKMITDRICVDCWASD